jgi:hypothetical protein
MAATMSGLFAAHQAVERWAEQQAQRCRSLQSVGVDGSYGRREAGVGSDLVLTPLELAAMNSLNPLPPMESIIESAVSRRSQKVSIGLFDRPDFVK